MSKQVFTEVQNELGEFEISYTREYTIDEYDEECHGIHRFTDYETKKLSIGSVILMWGDVEIDITNRLSKDEIKSLEQELW